MTEVGYKLVIDKYQRHNTDMILMKIRKLMYALNDYPGNLKIKIEVVEDEM